MTVLAPKVTPLDRTPFARGDHVECADRLVGKLTAEACTTFAEGFVYQYVASRGVFDRVEPTRLSRIVQGFAGTKVTGEKKPLRLKASDVGGTLKLAADQLADPRFFDEARRGVAFASSFVEVTGDRIIQHEHCPEHRARFAYRFGYTFDSEPVALLQFFRSVFRGDSDLQQKVQLVQEYLGISLLGLATRFQRALVLVGDGANGKGVLAAVAERSMPPNSVCSIAPQDIGQEYRRAALAGKLLNVVSELPEADILDSESWKSVVAGDTTTARAIRQSPFGFKPVAGHIYSANRLPGTTDQTHGFWRRLMVLQFNRIFDETEQNVNLADEILRRDGAAVVSWMLRGAQRVLANGMFTVPDSSVRAKDRWRARADQVRAFVEASTRKLALNAPVIEGMAADKLYRAYRTWAGENGHRPVASNTFGERMRLLGLPSRSDGRARRYAVELSTGIDHED